MILNKLESKNTVTSVLLNSKTGRQHIDKTKAPKIGNGEQVEAGQNFVKGFSSRHQALRT